MISVTPVVKNKLWELRTEGVHTGIVRADEDKLVMSTPTANTVVTRAELETLLGLDLFKLEVPITPAPMKAGPFPTCSMPYNIEVNLKTGEWSFSKSKKSKSRFAAGYFVIKFNKKWIKSFCPKLITLDRYQHFGPYCTLDEAKEKYQDVAST